MSVGEAPAGPASPASPTPVAARAGFLATTRWLVGARMRIAWNTIRRGGRWRRMTYGIVMAALAFLSLISLGASYGLTLWIGELTGNPAAADVVLATTISGTLTLAFLVSFTVALGALYLSADLDLLLVAPISRRAVFTSKLLAGLVPGMTLILLIGFVPLIGHGLANDYGLTYGLALLLGYAALPILPAAIGAVAVVVIVRRISAHRLGEIVGLIVVLMTLSIALVAGNSRQLRNAVTLSDLLGIFERLRSPYSPAEWLARGIAGAARGDGGEAVLWLGLYLAVAAVALIPLYFVSDRPYYEGWIRMQSANLRRQLSGRLLPWKRTDRPERLSRPSGLLRWLPQPTVAVLRKDLILIPRDLTNMAQVLSPLAVGVFFVIQQLLYPIRIGGTDSPQAFVQPILAMLSALIACAIAGMILSRFALTAFSFEGKRYWTIHGAPIAPRELVLGKFLVAYLPYLLVGGGLVVTLELARALNEAATLGLGFAPWVVLGFVSPTLLLYALFVVAVTGAGILAISLALGSARPNLTWDSPHEMTTPDLGCLSLVLYGGYMAIVVLALTAPAAVSRMAVLGDLRWALWAAGLGLGLGCTAVIVIGSFRLASQEVRWIGE